MADIQQTHPISQAREMHQEFLKHLQKSYNKPTDDWWTTVENTFKRLGPILGQKEATPVLDREETAEADSVRKARDHALPSVTVLPAGTHALRLAATNEPLECAVFGTLHPNTYKEVFWESTLQVQRAGDSTLVIHEADRGSVPRFLLTFESLLFDVRYYHSNALVRNYPNIVDAPAFFLRDLSNCEISVPEAVSSLKQERTLWEEVGSQSVFRDAYYYIRAWAILRGLFNSWDLTAQDILKLCQETDDNSDDLSDHDEIHEDHIQAFIALILNFFRHNPHKSDVPHCQYDGVWNFVERPVLCDDSRWFIPPGGLPKFQPYTLFMAVEAQPFHERMVFLNYIEVKILAMCASKVKIAAWISMVERKIQKLKERLEHRIFGKPKIKIWPQRMVTSHTKDSTYEGYYILGLETDHPGSDIPAARDVLLPWHKEIAKEELTKEAQAHVDVLILYEDYELSKLHLVPCTRVFPRPVLKPKDNGYNVQEQDGNSATTSLAKHQKADKKHRHNEQKRESNSEITSSRNPEASQPDAPEQHDNSKKSGLRRAKDIISRLRTDSNYDIDEFVVGYRDRHSERLLEKAAVNWVTETTDENWIPEHKIEYFKRYRDGMAEVMWDKATRLDKFKKSE